MSDVSSGSSRPRPRRRNRLTGSFLVWLWVLVLPSHGDEFTRLVGPPLFDLPHRGDARARDTLPIRAMEALPEVLQGERSTFVIATTDQGNVAKLLLSAGFRKRPAEAGREAMTPVLMIDRFETISSGDRVSWKARGKEIMLFDGSGYDLDSGQVVPAGFGGDLAFSARGPDGPQLSVLGSNKLYTFTEPLPIAPSRPGRPSSGRAVLPTDFDGRYFLVANGQLSGTLDLSVDPAGAVTGRFRSDKNGAVYPVSGTVAADLPRKIEFAIQFPRSRQDYEGLLWTEEKNAFAGTVLILEHPYSFLALREGTVLAPEGLDFDRTTTSSIAANARSRVVTLEDGPDRYAIDGQAKSGSELTVALAEAVKNEPRTSVILRVPETLPFERVNRAARMIRDAGITAIRVAPAIGVRDAD